MIFLPPLATTLKEEGALAREGRLLVALLLCARGEGFRLSEGRRDDDAIAFSASLLSLTARRYPLPLFLAEGREEGRSLNLKEAKLGRWYVIEISRGG